MTGTTSVPSISLTNTGWVAPSESAILTGVETDLDAAFGGGLIFNGSTPEDQLAGSQSAMVGDFNDQLLAQFNGCDPAFSTGRLQDGIGRIYFLTRNPATSTVAGCTCTGAAGTVIRQGAIAIATDGNLYYATGTGTISGGGTVSLNFACATTGPIACPAGSLNQIYKQVIGWDSINNVSDGVIGSNVETAQQFESRRQASVAGNSFGPIGAIIGAVANVANVLDFWGYSNNTAGTVTVSGVSIPTYSLYVSVEGGLDTDVAQAILSKKGGGAPMAGNTTVTAYDNNPLFSTPIAYSITFERPVTYTFLCQVTIKNLPGTPANAATLIGNQVALAFAGGVLGVNRARIGTTYYALQLLPALQSLWAGIEVISIQLGTTSSTAATFTGTIAGTALTVSGVTGTITAGMSLVAGGLAAGTYIVSGSGTSWVVNNSQTYGPGSMTGYTVVDNSEAISAAQVPALVAANVATILV